MTNFKALLFVIPLAYAYLGYLILLEGHMAISLTMFCFSILFAMVVLGINASNK